MTTAKFKVRKKKLGSYPYVSVVFSITLALFAMGVFGAVLIYSKELERIVRQNVKIQVFLKTQVTEGQRQQIEKSLASRYFVSKDNSVTAVQFVSKDEAARQFIQETGEDFKKFLGDNPLRDAYIIKIAEAYHDPKSLNKIKTEVEAMSGVYQVYYLESLIDSINRNVAKIAIILIGIELLLLVIVVLLINNTLRLALFSQRFLIRSMQLVGATRWFIQRPFVIRASFHGLVAGLIASGLLFSLLVFATKKITELTLVQNNDRLIVLFIAIILIGIGMAAFSTYRAVRKYLKLSLDELY